MFCPTCGHIMIGSLKEGEHKFCTKCEGADGKLKRVYPHTYFPMGDQDNPNEEHWIATCGYSTTKNPGERLEALKLATSIEILNREDCCPNFQALNSLGESKSSKRIRVIRNHLSVLIQHPQWHDGYTKERKIDLDAYGDWVKELE